jgi:hypothetical protein
MGATLVVAPDLRTTQTKPLTKSVVSTRHWGDHKGRPYVKLGRID